MTEAGDALKEKAVEIPGRIGTCLKLEQEEMMIFYKILYKILGQFES